MDLFNSGSGLDGNLMRIGICVLIVVILMFWAAWCSYKHFELFAARKIKENQAFMAIVKITVLIVFITATLAAYYI